LKFLCAGREQVEVLLAHRPDLQLTVDALRASCLPYRAAFDAQALPRCRTVWCSA
jgi:hypothetical protein